MQHNTTNSLTAIKQCSNNDQALTDDYIQALASQGTYQLSALLNATNLNQGYSFLQGIAIYLKDHLPNFSEVAPLSHCTFKPDTNEFFLSIYGNNHQTILEQVLDAASLDTYPSSLYWVPTDESIFIKLQYSL